MPSHHSRNAPGVQDRAARVATAIRLILANACAEIEIMLRDEFAEAKAEGANEIRPQDD
jgi:hypothetical protein